MSDLTFASEFPAPTRELWRELVDRVLKGGDFDRKLVATTYDGLRIEPLYPRGTESRTATPRPTAPWRIAQRVDHPEPGDAGPLALADLEGGADALVLTFAGAATARGFGLPLGNAEDLDRALSGAMLGLVAIRLEAGIRGRDAVRVVLDLADSRGHELSALDLELGLDPIGAMAAQGWMSAGWPTVGERLSDLTRDVRSRGLAGPVALADGRPYHEAGASEAQELAAVLSTALAYLRAIEAGGHDLETARGAISFLLVADADEFMSVAKMRALRRLWARIEEACGLDQVPLRLHAETAWRSATRRDPWVNLLRGTLGAFSAGIGGADTVAVLPFTTALGLPDAFARRLARNTQLILIEETNLWRVSDPVAGSGAFEQLTDGLCQEAWSRFGEIEREGGIVECLRAGFLQARIATTRARREAAIATRRDSITGTSEFPDLHEKAVAVLRPAPATAAPDAPLPAEAVAIELLPSWRVAGRFENLRDKADAMLRENGQQPRVFLANLGPIAAFSARATFAKNAFEAGGIEAPGNDGFPSQEALVAAFLSSGTTLACLCSSDEVYADTAVTTAKALKAAGAIRVYLAGRPGDLEPDLRAAGVTGFLAIGADLPTFLGDALASMPKALGS